MPARAEGNLQELRVFFAVLEIMILVCGTLTKFVRNGVIKLHWNLVLQFISGCL